MTRKRYHFVLPRDSETGRGPGRPAQRLCLCCARPLAATAHICPSCTADVAQPLSILVRGLGRAGARFCREAWGCVGGVGRGQPMRGSARAAAAETRELPGPPPLAAQEMQTHLLHGVLHTNGFGHLLRICGREAGSGVLAGRQLMALWEHLCGALRAKQVSVEDASKKNGMDFKLLHACAFGATWYGSFGYAFGRGPFGYSRADHAGAVAALRGFPLAHLRADFAALPRDDGAAVAAILDRYQGGPGGHALATLGCASRAGPAAAAETGGASAVSHSLDSHQHCARR